MSAPHPAPAPTVAAPSADAVVSAWQRGRHEHPIDRALTLLAAFTGASRHELAALSVERRDRLILAGRTAVFGGAGLVGFAACPACGCGVEVAVRADGHDVPDETFTLTVDGRDVTVRLPTSADLAAVAGCADVDDARAVLVRRVLDPVAAALAGRPDVVAALEGELTRRASVSAARVDLACPDCDAHWSLDVDAAAFTWREIEVLAARLLREVDVLARRYGWSEHDILALHPDRRRCYLELAS